MLVYECEEGLATSLIDQGMFLSVVFLSYNFCRILTFNQNLFGHFQQCFVITNMLLELKLNHRYILMKW